MADAQKALLSTQYALLRQVYRVFRAKGEWPMFRDVDRQFRQTYREDTVAVFRSMPNKFIAKSRSTQIPASTDQVRLTLAGAALCPGGVGDTRTFARLLRWLAKEEIESESRAGDGWSRRVTAQEIRLHLGIANDDAAMIGRLLGMIQLGGWGLGGIGYSGASDWYVNLDRDVWRFRSVKTVDDIVRVKEEWAAERRVAPPGTFRGGRRVSPFFRTSAESTRLSDPSYVDDRIATDIRMKADTGTFNVTKLLALIDELNDSVANKNPYSSMALIRAILDHVPPVFGLSKFDQVVNNYSWGPTDKKHVKNLWTARSSGDDALHRTISGDADLLTMESVPPPIWLNVLLRECAKRL